MSELEKLIKELCPNGVEYKPLGEVVAFNRGTVITQKDIEIGAIPVIAGGQKPAYYCNRSNREGETIVIAGSGLMLDSSVIGICRFLFLMLFQLM